MKIIFSIVIKLIFPKFSEVYIYIYYKINIGVIIKDIASLSIIMSQSNVQQSADISVMKMAMDTGNETAAQMTEMMKNVAVDPNLGQHFNAKA
ncbi:YjfB family protein [Clostridium pasteurianum]|uniref:YjfB family protein n=1 Tax=Clostridium pasteurianum TaxID=1501 RepID=UPI002260E4BE|nr:YjfB family protein [Clostridium pasteurianum]UZW16022.1 YjfB family protein [Clostridium pasteurianum]